MKWEKKNRPREKVNIRKGRNIFLSSLLALPLDSAQQAAALHYRKVPHADLQRFLQDPQFHYVKQQYETLSFWKQLLQGIRHFFQKLFGYAPSGQVIEFFIYALIIAFLIWAVIKLVGMDYVKAVIKPSAKVMSSYAPDHAQLSQENMEKALEEAKAQQDWKRVIELQYLLSLKALAASGQLELEKGKTNQDYVYELRSPKLKEPFIQLSRIFEYVWYGDFELQDATRAHAESHFQALLQQTKLG